MLTLKFASLNARQYKLMAYWIIRGLAKIIFKLCFQFKVEGLDNIPQKTNFIIVANHTSFLDPLIVQAAVPRKIHCLVLKGLYYSFAMRIFLKLEETFPVGSSSKRAIRYLKQNKIIGLFPEGRISRDGQLKEFRRGVALLALKTGRPVVPCAIFGAFEALPFGAKFPKLRPLKLRIGKPIYLLKEFEEVIDDIYLQEGIFKIRNTIGEMLNNG